MKFDILFEERVLVAEKLKACIRDFGYTKCSFAGLTNISRPTLDKLLSGSIDNKSSFDKHLKKVLALLDMTGEELLFYSASSVGRSVDVVYSLNEPNDYQMSQSAKKQYELLMDVLELCTIYY